MSIHYPTVPSTYNRTASEKSAFFDGYLDRQRGSVNRVEKFGHVGLKKSGKINKAYMAGWTAAAA